MDQSETAASGLRERVESTLVGNDWTVAGDPTAQLAVTLPDRTVLVTRHDAPGGLDGWSLTLRKDGATVSKFGRFDSLDAVCAQLARIQTSDVRYTVCCDGKRPKR